jgi:hypothetical protein
VVGFFLVKWLMMSYLCVAALFVLVFTGMLACFAFFSVVPTGYVGAIWTWW